MKSLFDVIVGYEKLHPNFKMLANAPANEPAKWMLDDVFKAFRAF